MKPLLAFIKKEILEQIRTGKLLILLCIFTAIGIMNPAIAKLTPLLLEILKDQIADSGITITDMEINALTSWTQFFKNIPIALIAFVCLYSSTFTKEYESNTLIIMLTKGFKRYKVILSKTIIMIALWTIGYFLSFIITYAYNEYFWDNSIATGLSTAILNWYLFGLFIICLIVLFSCIGKSSSMVLLSTGLTVIILYAFNIVPKLVKYNPISLMNSALILTGVETNTTYLPSFIITIVLSITAIIVSIPIFNKKSL